jgi:hypothetical protein
LTRFCHSSTEATCTFTPNHWEAVWAPKHPVRDVPLVNKTDQEQERIVAEETVAGSPTIPLLDDPRLARVVGDALTARSGCGATLYLTT